MHRLAMNIVGKHLEGEGFEFLAVNSELEKNPQFVCLKDKEMHFVVVRPMALGSDPADYDRVLMKKVKDHADTFEARTHIAGVGLENRNNPNRPLRKDEPYLMHFTGLIEWKP